MMTEPQRRAVEAAVARFPAEFSLRGFPGKRFRVSPEDSYWSEAFGGPLVYVEVRGDDGAWSSFAKGTPDVLRREVVT